MIVDKESEQRMFHVSKELILKRRTLILYVL